MHFRRFKNVVGDREKRDISDDHAYLFLRLTDGTFLWRLSIFQVPANR
ncbi:MAG: hypothetical protein NVS3B14_19680 [Ktedonobacteraceae bacterium]